MRKDFEAGDHVSWDSEAGRVWGTIRTALGPTATDAGEAESQAAFYETLPTRDLH